MIKVIVLGNNTASGNLPYPTTNKICGNRKQYESGVCHGACKCRCFLSRSFFVATSKHVPRQVNLSGNPCGPHDITRDYARVGPADRARGPTVRSRVVITQASALQRSPHNPSLCHSVRFLRVVCAALRVGCSMRLRCSAPRARSGKARLLSKRCTLMAVQKTAPPSPTLSH